MNNTVDDIAGWVTAGATVALVLATGVLAWYTWQLVKVTRRPSVVATIEPHPWGSTVIDLHVTNEGTAAAYDIEVVFDPPIPSRLVDDGRPPFPRISALGSGQRLSGILAEFSEVETYAAEATISWRERPRGPKRSISYKIDIGALAGWMVGRNPAVTIAQQLEHLRNDWRGVASGSTRLKVDQFDARDRLREQRDRMRAWRRQARPRKPPGQGGE